MAEDFQYDVFLSYRSSDRGRVSRLAERLREAGLRVWFDEWSVPVGADILLAVEDGLQQSRTLVLCLSPVALGSGWVALERSTVLFRDPSNTRRSFIPLLLSDCDLPDALRRYKYVDWREETDAAFRILLDACRPRSPAGTEARSDSPARGRPRVCMISSEYPPHVLGGLGVHVTRLSEALGVLADVDLVLPHRPGGYVAPPAGVRTHPMSRVEASYDDPISWLHFAQHAFNLVEEIAPKPAVIHCHDWVTALAGIKCRWLLNVPLVFHVHLPNRTPFCSSVENLGLLCADLVTVSSQAMLEELKDRLPSQRMAVVPNGVDTRAFAPGDSTADADRYVLFAGRLVEQKGVDHLLRAFVHVRKRFPALELWIAGSGPCDLAYRRLADCLLIGDSVRFLGWKGDLDLSKLYRGASVVAVPSIYEPFGMTALEAMACARPVVASNTGGLKEVVQHGVTGYLAERGDHLDLAQWLIRLIDRKDLRRELGDRGGRVVHDSVAYQWPTIARQYAAFYEQLSREPPDLKVPTEAEEYLRQIRSLAYRQDPGASTMCDDLFVWSR